MKNRCHQGLTAVTITGADDGVEPAVLADLSSRFPFVEWGILFSPKREGTPRYPSRTWRNQFYQLELRHALHLCGKAARDTLEGHPDWVALRPKRVQLNGYSPPARALQRLDGIEWILQCRSEASLQEAVHDAERLRAGVLYDPSGGCGTEPFRWPAAPLGCRLGYAGGIRPDNVEQVLRDIEAARLHTVGDYWIDMESGVRSADHFDLVKVSDVLERAASHMARAT